MFIYDDEVVDVNMSCLLWIYILETDIAWFHDLIVPLMHDSIMIDRLMFWMMMTKGSSHLEGETLHKIPTSIFICIGCMENSLLLKFSDVNRQISDVADLQLVLVWEERVSLRLNPNRTEASLLVWL